MNLELTEGERRMLTHAQEQARNINHLLDAEALDTEGLREVRRLTDRIKGTVDYLLAKQRQIKPPS